jgi:excisionase family DNA binding protein
MTKSSRDVLTPREVAERAGFSYHAILRAIRRGDLTAFEPVAGHYRIDLDEYERWLRRPARRNTAPLSAAGTERYSAATRDPLAPGSFARLRSIERS